MGNEVAQRVGVGGSNRVRSADATRARERVSQSEAPASTGNVVSLAARRHVDSELRRTDDWVRRLPPETRPHLLAREYPRTASRLDADWDDPERCWRHLDDLIQKHRPGSDFRPWLLIELYSLRTYYAGLHPGLERVRFLRR